MSNIETGMLVKSLAGHDKDSIYFVERVEGEFVYVADGRLKTVDNLKRKNKKHIQVIHKVYDIEETQNNIIKNEIIEKLIREYKSKQK